MKNATKKRKGLVIGKFSPFHKGHELLLKFASHFSDELYVVVDKLSNEIISGEIRCQWIKKTLGEVKVYYLNEINPQKPEEHADFWNIWKNSLFNILPEKPDFVFASEHYGFKLAEMMNAVFIPFDLERSNININASEISKNLFKHWHYLSDVAKTDVLMRICIFGPESTGKTTLAKELAKYFNTIYVPEYARLLIQAKGSVQKEDMVHVAKGQIALEHSMAEKANRILFCDTDPLATSIWYQWLFNENSSEINEIYKNINYDLYLLTDIDIDWEPDLARYFPGNRKEFMHSCVKSLEENKRPYSIVRGKGEERTKNAIKIVSEKIDEFFNKTVWNRFK